MTTPARDTEPLSPAPEPTTGTPAPERARRRTASGKLVGRRSKERLEYEKPYVVDRYPSGSFFMRYTRPGRTGRETLALCPPSTDGRPTKPTQDARVAEKLAAAHWDAMVAKHRRVVATGEPDVELSFPALVQQWKDGLCRRVCSEQAKDAYVLQIDRWVEHTSLSRLDDIRNLNSKAVEAACDELLGTRYVSVRRLFKSFKPTGETYLREHEVTRTAVRAHLNTLRTFIAELPDGARITDPVSKALLKRFPSAKRPDFHVYSPEEMVKLIDTMQAWDFTSASASTLPMALLLMFTGARYNEVARLRVSDIDLVVGTIRFRNSKPTEADRLQGVYRYRFFPIGIAPIIGTILRDWLRRSGASGDDYVFPKVVRSARKTVADKCPWRNDQPLTWLREVCERAGVPYRSFHVFRHTFMSLRVHMLKRVVVSGQECLVGVTDTDLKNEVGHTPFSDTARKVYVHGLPIPTGYAITELDFHEIARLMRAHRVEQMQRVNEVHPVIADARERALSAGEN